MYQIFTCFILVFLAHNSLSGQTSTGNEAVLKVEPRQVNKSTTLDAMDTDYEEVSSIRLTNNSNQRLQLRYDKVIDIQPQAWRSIVFRKGSNQSPGRSGSFDSGTFTINAGETVEFQLIVQPNGIGGTGRIRIPFVDAQRPGRPLATASFRIEIDQLGQQTNETPALRPSIRVYPNPAPKAFFIELPRNERFGRVEVYNTLGRRMKVFNEEPGPDGFDIERLPEGLYLVNIYNSQGEKLRTLRLLHPRGGA
ncbi:MAG: T9SS type A sorting domain-containing protein [Bacteroidota bacterium]